MQGVLSGSKLLGVEDKCAHQNIFLVLPNFHKTGHNSTILMTFQG